MKEAVVEQEVKTYFTDRFPSPPFFVSQQCEIQFGTRYGIADETQIGSRIRLYHTLIAKGYFEMQHHYEYLSDGRELIGNFVDYQPYMACHCVARSRPSAVVKGV